MLWALGIVIIAILFIAYVKISNKIERVVSTFVKNAWRH